MIWAYGLQLMGDDGEVTTRRGPAAGASPPAGHGCSRAARCERGRQRPAARVSRRELGRDPQRGLRRPPVIAVDTNVLVYAHRRDSEFHRAAAAKVRELAEGRAPWALPWPSLHEFFSIVTHPRIYDPPSRVDQALEQIDAWLETASAVVLAEGETYWPRLRDLLADGKISGPVVHDARIAALCLTHGVQALWTADRDFGRFPRLRTVNPLI